MHAAAVNQSLEARLAATERENAAQRTTQAALVAKITALEEALKGRHT
jgi:hypothetical protein